MTENLIASNCAVRSPKALIRAKQSTSDVNWQLLRPQTDHSHRRYCLSPYRPFISELDTNPPTGGGIIGCSIAYYLSRHPSYSPETHRILLFEAQSIGAAASGKAGGFVGAWATPKCLGQLSFNLHAQLASEHDGENAWGYRRVYGWDVQWRDTRQHRSIEVSHSESHVRDDDKPRQEGPPDVNWLRPSVVEGFGPLGTPADSAQVNPLSLTWHLVNQTIKRGVGIVYGEVHQILNFFGRPGVVYTTSGRTSKLAGDDVIVAAGPWTTQLIPGLLITPLRSHSIVVRSPEPLSANVLFPIHAQENSTRDTEGVYPEMYPRPPDILRKFPSLYTCGPDDTDTPLERPNKNIPVSDTAIEELAATIHQVSPVLADGEVLARQACYKPQLRAHGEGEEVGPAIGRVPKWNGVWVAAGHDEWGISNGPATGLVMAEMVMEGRSRMLGEAAHMLDPKHFMFTNV